MAVPAATPGSPCLLKPSLSSRRSTAAASYKPPSELAVLGLALTTKFNSKFVAGKRHRDVSAGAIWSRKSSSQQPDLVVEVNQQPEEASNSKASSSAAATNVVEEEVEISWVQEKADELLRLTNPAIKSIPGPRVGESQMPWLLAAPLAYFSITFVVAVYRTIKKYRSPKSTKKRLIGKNAFLVTSIDNYLPDRRLELDHETLKQLQRKSGFDAEEVVRKYVRYALNERKFGPDVVADLIHLRKVSGLDDETIAQVLNEVSERIVKGKGRLMMNLEGLTVKGVQRKVAVQSLFSKLLYLSELDDFCSSARASLRIKEIFGVTDEDASSLRIETLSELSDIDSLEKIIDTEEQGSG